MDILFAVQSYKDDSLPVSSQEMINALAELEPPDAKTPVKVSGVPGISTFAMCGAGPIRGFCELKGVLYLVSFNALYSLTLGGTTTLLGVGIGGLGIVGMDTNGIEVCIVNGSSGWIYNTLTATFTQITDGNFNAANTVAAIDNYFIFDHVSTNQFFLSPLLAGLGPYDATQFGTADAQPGRVLGVHNAYGILVVAGEHSLEPWQDTGALSFPWQRIANSTVELGIAAPFAWAEAGNQHYFLGADLIFYQLVGTSNPQRLSTHALEAAWGKYSTTADAFCHVVQHFGHKIIYVTFPTGNATFGYDVATQLWHRRASWDPSGAINRWRANCSVFAFNSKMLIGDANSGQIGLIDQAVYTEFGNPLVLDMTAPHIDGKGAKGFMPEFQLDMETGTGIASGQGSNPQVALMYSDDGGRTFSPENWMPIGATGTYLTRARWTRLGSFYQRALRIKISDPVKRTIVRARAPGLSFGTGGQ